MAKSEAEKELERQLRAIRAETKAVKAGSKPKRIPKSESDKPFEETKAGKAAAKRQK